jgi:hypothetical protein
MIDKVGTLERGIGSDKENPRKLMSAWAAVGLTVRSVGYGGQGFRRNHMGKWRQIGLCHHQKANE